MRWWRPKQRAYQPGTQAYGQWRQYADTVEGSGIVVDRKDNGQVYEVSWVRSEAVALEYLRGRDVRLEGHYVIVETLGRNLGRDMIMIFDEADGSLIEIPERTPLPEPTPSTTHCARCGYPILPCRRVESGCDDPDCDHPWHTAEFAEGADELIRAGRGYRCTRCRSGACRACYEATGGENVTTTHGFLLEPGDERALPSEAITMRLCWVCRSPVTVFDE
ncbi:hypothetical protein [Pseudonocardia acaciae]|uniref:hypothetical protein n=1 Tax=Pseudonocardia acaciae TaxID=551276 RepID=UPI00048FA22F|nr:hypothetical protein [Pseudonocardia acaciae]